MRATHNMKKTFIVLCLTILTAALLVASTATTFATPDTGVPPYTDTTSAIPLPAPSTPSTITEAITLETTLDIGYVEQPNSTAPELEVKVPEAIELPEADVHVCKISRATESYHRYSCDECENYSRVNHDETTMTLRENGAWFHVWACEDCGYEYAEKHNTRVSHNPTSHYDVCIDCGYKAEAENHTMVNSFWSYYHGIECADCRYEAERHIGVTYTPYDTSSCMATCKECNVTEVIPHDWDGFECVNCGYKAGLFNVGVIVTAEYVKTEDSEFLCELELLVNDVYIYVDVNAYEFQNWNCNEGDLVLIFHQGNEVYDISQLVDVDVVDDPKNFLLYAYEDLIPNVDELTFGGIVIDEIEYYDDEVFITFESGRAVSIDTPYVVYDLRDSTSYYLSVGDAVLTYCPFGTMTYVVVIW